MTIYDFTVKGIDGQDVSLGSFRGKVILIVNTATRCGFTPQYTGLQKLYDVYKDKEGTVVRRYGPNRRPKIIETNIKILLDT